MDKYFCCGCLARWRVGDIMNTCPGCIAHQRQGWTTQQLVDVYGPILERCEKVFFPRLERHPITRSPMPNDVDVNAARRWLKTCPDLLPGFRTQQKTFLDAFETSPTRANWNIIDPETQLHTLHLRYT